jgi:hypothetical protein
MALFSDAGVVPAACAEPPAAGTHRNLTLGSGDVSLVRKRSRARGLYNDSQYRYQRMRDDDDYRRYGYRPAYRYDDDGDLIYSRTRQRD